MWLNVSDKTILLLDSDDLWREQLKRRLARDRFRVVEIDDPASLVAAFQNGAPVAAVIAASSSTPSRLFAALAGVRAIDSRVPLILTTCVESEALAIEALRAGMNDYLRRPVPVDAVAASVQRCLSEAGSRTPAAPSNRPAAASAEPVLMRGDSPKMKAVRAFIARAAANESNVLITGETGTGKELAAELIHRSSPRHARPFISINCAAIPDGLLESELFGYESGAFTGAHAMKEGQLQLAAGGTVFFDEIGDMSVYAQAKILRAIEGKPLYRLGGRRAVALDIRVVAATNQDLDRAMADGRFRSDLYYRLNVARIQLPPLRERAADIPLLVAHTIDHFNARFRRDVTGLTDEALRCLVEYDWPGNVRELRNVIEALFINLPLDARRVIDLPEDLRSRLAGARRPPAAERDQLLAVLSETNWNKSKAAEKLQWSRMTLYRKMAKYHIVREAAPEAAPADSEVTYDH